MWDHKAKAHPRPGISPDEDVGVAFEVVRGSKVFDVLSYAIILKIPNLQQDYQIYDQGLSTTAFSTARSLDQHTNSTVPTIKTSIYLEN